MRFMKFQFITCASIREYWFVAGVYNARAISTTHHRRSPRTNFGDDPRGHEDYYSINDPSSLELFTKLHCAVTRLVRNHVYARHTYVHVWTHGRDKNDTGGYTHFTLSQARKKKAFNGNYVCQNFFNNPFNKPNNLF